MSCYVLHTVLACITRGTKDDNIILASMRGHFKTVGFELCIIVAGTTLTSGTL